MKVKIHLPIYIFISLHALFICVLRRYFLSVVQLIHLIGESAFLSIYNALKLKEWEGINYRNYHSHFIYNIS